MWNRYKLHKQFYDYYDKKLSKEELNAMTEVLENAVGEAIDLAKERK